MNADQRRYGKQVEKPFVVLVDWPWDQLDAEAACLLVVRA